MRETWREKAYEDRHGWRWEDSEQRIIENLSTVCDALKRVGFKEKVILWQEDLQPSSYGLNTGTLEDSTTQ